MTRVRGTEALIAALATVLVAWPLTTLFAPNVWIRPTLLVVLVVALSGMAVRWVTSSGALVVVGQLVSLALVASWLHGRGHLWHGLPTADTVRAFNNLLADAVHTVQSFAAPAPANRGVVLAIGLAIGLAAIVVDYLAVTCRSPALAGLPLLTAYLISAANSGTALHWGYFLAPAAVWLVMVGRQGVGAMRRWSTATSRAGTAPVVDDADATVGFAAAGRALGVGGLVLALVLPAFLPHLPTRFLVDGLGRSSSATGFSDGQVGLTDTLDLDRSLRSPSTSPVLSYRTDDPTPPPLRVESLDDYRFGRWLPSHLPVSFATHPPVAPPGEIDEQVKRVRRHLDVVENRVQPPQLAAPYPVTGGSLHGVPWGVDDSLAVRVQGHAERYSLDYLELEPTRAMLEQPTAEPQDGFPLGDDLTVAPDAEPDLRRVLRDIVPAKSSRIDTAMAIQGFLRGPDFTYSLDLPAHVLTQDGRPVSPDPVSQFLVTKRGYCVQFATAMVMLARASGIPARMAIGFLPGSVDKNTYTVHASDAHSWPELFFNGVGWLRFEPTPSSRSGAAPGYTLPSAPSTSATDNPTSPATSAVAGPSSHRPDGSNDPGAANPRGAGSSTGVVAWWASVRALPWPVWLLLLLLAAAVALLTVPLAARMADRRALQAAADDAERAEATWQALLRRVRDHGIDPPVGCTPRQTGEHVRQEAYLQGEPRAALARVVAALERSRYAPPGTAVRDVGADARVVLVAVARSRRRPDRLRAAVLPQQGLQWWSELGLQVASLPGRLWRRLRVRLLRPVTGVD